MRKSTLLIYEKVVWSIEDNWFEDSYKKPELLPKFVKLEKINGFSEVKSFDDKSNCWRLIKLEKIVGSRLANWFTDKVKHCKFVNLEKEFGSNLVK